jgi:predicted transcriptional regulator of viral defense system
MSPNVKEFDGVSAVMLSKNKFFGFEPVDVLGYKAMNSDREKTAIDCIDRPALAGGGSSY